MAKGTSTATTSDANGNFTMQMPGSVNTLVVSYVGFMSREITPSSGYTNVFLNENSKSLDEVVIVGYGTSKEGSEGYYDTDKSYKKRKEETAVNTTTVYPAYHYHL